jgi:methylmalonyl-CoA mutase
MTALVAPPVDTFTLLHKVRVVTAASLFDGHDAAIQIMRRILQSEGAEVIHLGHDRSVHDVVDCAIEEDAQAIAVSSYQGGHMEYFTYMRELLVQRGAGHIHVFGGGGGVIVPAEIAALAKKGVRIFSPDDGRRQGLVGMIHEILRVADHVPGPFPTTLPVGPLANDRPLLARAITAIEHDDGGAFLDVVRARQKSEPTCPVLGITGTGGAGKSSLIDELLLRFLDVFPTKTIAVLSVDPTRKKTGGALLGDRIRMNAASNTRVFARSMATRRANLATSAAVKDTLTLLKTSGFDLVILETAGIGQSDSEVTELCDHSLYVMTPEFGAPSQLEKIDMLDFADFVAINKFDKRGALDALRDVRKVVQRNKKLFDTPAEAMPVFGTSAHRFHDPGTNTLFNALMKTIGSSSSAHAKSERSDWSFTPLTEGAPKTDSLIPAPRTRYLGEIASTVRRYHQESEEQAVLAEKLDGVRRTLSDLGDAVPDIGALFGTTEHDDVVIRRLRERHNALTRELPEAARTALARFDDEMQRFTGSSYTYQVRGKTIAVEAMTTSLSGTRIAKVATPQTKDLGDRVRFLASENVPGSFPYTAGVFPLKRTAEDPTRMFAGEGLAERTNRRFHYLAKGQRGVRLSTAFDSVTLYGADPDPRPDIFGKVGNSGVSVCCLDDAKRLYSGFDLLAPSSSVSMTINGPAPTVLAFFFNMAIDAACERKLKSEGRWRETEQKIAAWFKDRGFERPTYRASLPDTHDGVGLGFLGLSADRVMDKAEYDAVKKHVLQTVRGTVQADILKEDQAQNTCIFSTEFALRMMGDVQQFFVDHDVKNFYSVSVSGYHIAEAGANPITQLAFTLANGFTLVEAYRARGMRIDDFAPNFSFFFSNGLDAEYSVIGRVARRIWSVAMRDLYGADERSQKLKYHIQTSGRSLHAQEIQFNDIRTTLQALSAIADNTNSLHTNAYDEAITTPTEESVRRALAIQLIINRELGLTKNENPMQGSHFIEQLTDLVEEAVLKEFEALDARGGVLGAMETMYQRGKIQDESMHYEHLKHSGELPIVGVNTFLAENANEAPAEVALIRSSDDEKNAQIDVVRGLAARFSDEREVALTRLKNVAREGGNVFAELMEATKVCSLGSISRALFDVGGAYRRNM